MSAAFRGQREEVEQMKSCLRVLSQPIPPAAGEAELATDQQDREGALELLADLCENMDNAAGTASPHRAGTPHPVRLSPHPFSPGPGHQPLPASAHAHRYHRSTALLAPHQVTGDMCVPLPLPHKPRD